MTRFRKPGPPLDPLVGPLIKTTLLLDDTTRRMMRVLGDNLSDGARKATRSAFDLYQKMAEARAPAPRGDATTSTKTGEPDVP